MRPCGAERRVRVSAQALSGFTPPVSGEPAERASGGASRAARLPAAGRPSRQRGPPSAKGRRKAAAGYAPFHPPLAGARLFLPLRRDALFHVSVPGPAVGQPHCAGLCPAAGRAAGGSVRGGAQRAAAPPRHGAVLSSFHARQRKRRCERTQSVRGAAGFRLLCDFLPFCPRARRRTFRPAQAEKAAGLSLSGANLHRGRRSLATSDRGGGKPLADRSGRQRRDARARVFHP